MTIKSTASIIKVVLFLALALVPATASDTTLDPLTAAANQHRKAYIAQHQSETHFGLLAGRPPQIQRLRAHGHTKGWTNFVATGVADRYAAVDFLNKAVPLFSAEAEAKTAGGIITNIGKLLTLDTIALRAANKEERKIIVAGTVQVALDHCAREGKGDREDKLSVAFWEKYFAGQHGALAKNARIQRTIRTRAVAAALAAACIYTTDTSVLENILKASGMEYQMYNNFLDEVFPAAATIMGAHVTRAAEKGSAAAQANLAFLMKDSSLAETFLGIKKDEEKAMSWFKQAAGQGNALAIYELALCEQDATKKDAMFVQAAAGGYDKAMRVLARKNQENPAIAADWYRKAIEKGSVEAMQELAVLLKESDRKAAIDLFEKAAVRGNFAATLWMAEIREEEGDNKAAARWYLPVATEHNDSRGMRALAKIRASEGDRKAAIDWYRKLFETGQGNSDDKIALADLLAAEKDFKEAGQLYRQAASSSDRAGLWMVGALLFGNVSYGIDKDPQAALRYATSRMKSAMYADGRVTDNSADEEAALHYNRVVEVESLEHFPSESDFFTIEVLSKCPPGDKGENILAWYRGAIAKAKAIWERSHFNTNAATAK